MRRGMVDITMAYIAGIVAASHVSVEPKILIVVFFGFFALIWFSRYRSHGLMRLGLVVMLIAFGWLNASIRQNGPRDNDVSVLADRGTVEIYGTVWEEPVVDNTQTTVNLRVSSAVVNGVSQSVSGTLRVMIRHSYGPVVSLSFGDMVRMAVPVYIPDAPSNPGQFDFRAQLERQGIYGVAYVYPWTEMEVIGKEKLPWWKAARSRLLFHIRKCIDSSVSFPYNALLRSLLLGEKHVLPDSILAAFEGAGILHVLTVSGLHVGFVAFILFWMATGLGLERKRAAVVGIVGIFMYAFVVGFRASVVRATVMTGMMFFGIVMERERDLLTSLALSAFLICLVSPQSIFDVGFQLSFAAVLGIVQLRSFVRACFPPMPKWLRDSVSVSLSAFLATMPISAFYFNSIYPVGVLANLLCVPVAGFCVKLGFMLILLGGVSIWFARIVGVVAEPALRILSFLARLFSSIPGGMVHVGTPSRWFVVFYYCLLIWVVFPERLNPFLKRDAYYRRKGVIALCLIIALLVWIEVIGVFIPRIEVTFLDVGFGDAVFIQTHTGHTMLIDGGSGRQGVDSGFDGGLHVVVPFLRHKGIRRIDVVVLSHPHEDHAGGLVSVIRTMNVGIVCGVAARYDSNTYETFLRTLEDKHLDLLEVSDGTIIQLGSDTTVQVLHPPYGSSWTATNVNNHSAVMRIEFGDLVFMFTGDIERQAEGRLVAKGGDLKAQVLKVPHHGSDTSTTIDFLRGVNPEIAVISVGRNSYGLPSEQVMSRLKQENVEVYRTDKDGAITIVGRKNALFVRTVKQRGQG